MSVQTIGVTKPRMELVTVTPQLALTWLDNHNTHNRPLSPSRVRAYAETMTKGLWRHPTGEPVIFDRTGTLQDGQHRLAAQVESGSSVDYWVNFDADPADFTVIDQGRSRTASDVLSMQGMANANTVAAIARTVLAMSYKSDKVWTGQLAVPALVADFASKNRDNFILASKVAKNVRGESRIPSTPFGSVFYWVNDQCPDSEQLADFVAQVKNGVGLREGSPTHTLRKWGIQRSTSHGVRAQMGVVFVTKAWNAFASGKPLKKLVWLDSEMPMPLPIPAAF